MRGQAPATIVLDHVRLIDGTGAPPRDDVRIVVRGDRIVAVQAASEAGTTIPADAERIDLGGRVVMPGLIDLHSTSSAIPGWPSGSWPTA